MAEKTKVTLHWLEKSRSQRILWLIYELDIPTKCDFELKTYKRGSDMLAEASLSKVHPLGKSPTIEIQAAGQAKSIVIAESGAIVEYLCEHYGRHLIPKRYPEGKDGEVGMETEGYLRYLQLMHYAEGSLMGLLVLALIVQTMKDGPQTPFFAKPITRIIGGRIESAFLNRNLASNFAFLEQQLATSPEGGKFFCGPELSGVDIMLIYPLEAASGRVGLTKTTHPEILAYVERIQAREAYKKSVQKIIDTLGEYNPNF